MIKMINSFIIGYFLLNSACTSKQVYNTENQGIEGISKESVRLAIKNNSSNISKCYEDALKNDNSLKGQITFSFQISSSGQVISIQETNTDINNIRFKSCVSTVIQKIKFPNAENGNITNAIYPFRFEKSLK